MVTSIFAAIIHNMRGWSFYVVICLPHSNRQSSRLKHHDSLVCIMRGYSDDGLASLRAIDESAQSWRHPVLLGFSATDLILEEI